MDRKDWKASLRRIKPTFRRGVTSTGPSKRIRVKGWAGWTVAVIVALMLAGVSLRTRQIITVSIWVFRGRGRMV